MRKAIVSPGAVMKANTDLQSLAKSIGRFVDGNKSATGASSGEFVVLLNSTISGRTDGLYTASKAIPANTAIDSSYLTASSTGGLNALNANITITTISSGDLDDYVATSMKVKHYSGSNINNFTNVPAGLSSYGFMLDVFPVGSDVTYSKQVLTMYSTYPIVYERQQYYSGGKKWGAWEIRENMHIRQATNLNDLSEYPRGEKVYDICHCMSAITGSPFVDGYFVTFIWRNTEGGASNIIHQIGFEDDRSVIKERYYKSASGWSDWIDIVKSSEYSLSLSAQKLNVRTNNTNAALEILGTTKKFTITIASNGTITGSVTDI